MCGRPLFEVPLFRFTGMPSVAQNFPDQDSLSEDRGADFEVAQCSGCGLVQLPREPVAYYRDVIRAAGVSPEMTSHRHEQFASFTRTFELAGKPVIEIGCGGGEYLQMLRDAGLSAVGLEHSKAGVAACRAKGLRVYQGFVDSARYQIPGAPYAGFVMLSCLEHLPDVNGALQGLGHNLLPGAIGMVEVPNFDNCLAERAVAEFMTDHLSYFTRDSLATTLQLNGFEVLECRPTGHDYLLTAIVRRRTPHSVAAFHQVTQQLDAALDAFLGQFGEREVVAWGAGHHALAAIALHRLQHRLAYVVDSAPFKQGRFTPATHLPVYAPERLQHDATIQAVLILGAIYSDEIASILRRDFPSRFSLAILRPAVLELLGGP